MQKLENYYTKIRIARFLQSHTYDNSEYEGVCHVNESNYFIISKTLIRISEA